MLRRRLVEGGFPPGTRLDPARLKRDLATSTTPIRDALHRLTGEGLVEGFENEGFRVPPISETAMRDRYEWSHELCRIALRAGAGRLDLPAAKTLRVTVYADDVTVMLHAVASLSYNHYVRRAITDVCDKSYALRHAEAALLGDASLEIQAIGAALGERNWEAATVRLDAFHARRQDLVPRLAMVFRDRTKSDFDNLNAPSV